MCTYASSSSIFNIITSSRNIPPVVSTENTDAAVDRQRTKPTHRKHSPRRRLLRVWRPVFLLIFSLKRKNSSFFAPSLTTTTIGIIWLHLRPPIAHVYCVPRCCDAQPRTCCGKRCQRGRHVLPSVGPSARDARRQLLRHLHLCTSSGRLLRAIENQMQQRHGQPVYASLLSIVRGRDIRGWSFSTPPPTTFASDDQLIHNQPIIGYDQPTSAPFCQECPVHNSGTPNFTTVSYGTVIRGV